MTSFEERVECIVRGLAEVVTDDKALASGVTFLSQSSCTQEHGCSQIRLDAVTGGPSVMTTSSSMCSLSPSGPAKVNYEPAVSADLARVAHFDSSTGGPVDEQ